MQVIVSNGVLLLALGNIRRPIAAAVVIRILSKAPMTTLRRARNREPIPVQFPTTRDSWRMQCSEMREGLRTDPREDRYGSKDWNANERERQRRSMDRRKWDHFSTRRSWEEVRSKRTLH